MGVHLASCLYLYSPFCCLLFTFLPFLSNYFIHNWLHFLTHSSHLFAFVLPPFSWLWSILWSYSHLITSSVHHIIIHICLIFLYVPYWTRLSIIKTILSFFVYFFSLIIFICPPNFWYSLFVWDLIFSLARIRCWGFIRLHSQPSGPHAVSGG